MTFTEVLKENISKSNVRLFFVLLLITSAIWLIIQLSKTYSTRASINALITNIPIDRVVDNKKVNIDYKLKTSGFKLLWLNLKSNQIELSLDNFQASKGFYKLDVNKLASILSDKYLIEENSVEFDKKMISINFSERQVKSVGIKPQLTYTFAPGYNSVGRIDTTPDSVKISGKRNEVAQLSYLKTEEIKVENIDDTLKLQANLKVPSDNINVETNEVELFLAVQKFTEDEKVLPVNLVNVPDSLQVNYFPKNVSVNYLVPISMYNKVNDEQFKIECNYNEKFIKQGILIPELVKKPENIKNISINPYKVEYLIKK